MTTPPSSRMGWITEGAESLGDYLVIQGIRGAIPGRREDPEAADNLRRLFQWSKGRATRTRKTQTIEDSRRVEQGQDVHYAAYEYTYPVAAYLRVPFFLSLTVFRQQVREFANIVRQEQDYDETSRPIDRISDAEIEAAVQAFVGAFSEAIAEADPSDLLGRVAPEGTDEKVEDVWYGGVDGEGEWDDTHPDHDTYAAPSRLAAYLEAEKATMGEYTVAGEGMFQGIRGEMRIRLVPSDVRILTPASRDYDDWT